MILVNGVADGLISPLDRGLCYGDGVFRTMRVASGRIVLWDRHWERFCLDCAALTLPPPARELLESEFQTVLAGQADAVLKLTLTRGIGLRGYASPDPPLPTRIVTSSALPHFAPGAAETGVVLYLCALRLAEQPLLAGVKHLNRLENVLARNEWNDPAIAEGILLDAAGRVIEGTMSNVFIVENGQLLTPRLDRCGVRGVTREWILQAAAAQGVSAQQQDFGIERLQQADEVFLCNSLIGLWPVRQFLQCRWSTFPVTARLREAWQTGCLSMLPKE